MIHRRCFLKNAAVVALTPTLPTFLARSLRAAEPERDQRILVVIQLDGGNDGINTVVPFRDEGYARNRKTLRLKTSELIKLDDESGLHPRMTGVAELFHDGLVSIVQGVGYPNPNRSHFRSMAIWHAADTNVEDQNGSGWLGQSLAPIPNQIGPDAIFLGDSELPIALRGRRCVSATLSNPEDISLKLDDLQTDLPASGDGLTSFLQRSVSEAYATAQSLSEAERKSDSGSRYPSSELGNRLELVSQLIKSGATARVYYTSQGGYDTHAGQLNEHANLLGTFSGALKAFMDDLDNSGLSDQVMVMAFSEFGRRVRENGSAGTDHGTAGPVFLAGTQVQARLIGKTPSLTDLDDGDLKFSTDFRSIYVTLIEHWLQLNRPKFLRPIEFLPLFGKAR